MDIFNRNPEFRELIEQFGLETRVRTVRQPLEWQPFLDTFFETRGMPRLEKALREAPVNISYIQTGNVYTVLFASEPRRSWFAEKVLPSLQDELRRFMQFDRIQVRTALVREG